MSHNNIDVKFLNELIKTWVIFPNWKSLQLAALANCKQQAGSTRG